METQISFFKNFLLLIILVASCTKNKDQTQPNPVGFEWPPLYQGTTLTQVTNNSNNSWDFHCRWSKDGKKVCFANYNNTAHELTLRIWSESDNNIEIVVEGMWGDFSPSWSPDDSKIAFDARINFDGTNLNHIATGNSSGSENWPSWSPDETKIVYQLFNGDIARIVMKDLETNEVFLLTENDD
ncbi:MAG: hypothetical protein HC831_10860, partial [Chloroflexia bacterium]|nr:hypothetical protein [Chloroflexia bacterium]